MKHILKKNSITSNIINLDIGLLDDIGLTWYTNVYDILWFVSFLHAIL